MSNIFHLHVRRYKNRPKASALPYLALSTVHCTDTDFILFTMSTFDIPVDIETSEISSTLNSVILFIFLMGIFAGYFCAFSLSELNNILQECTPSFTLEPYTSTVSLLNCSRIRYSWDTSAVVNNPSKYHPVPVVITVLYMFSIAEMAFQWYGTKSEFVDNGDTRQSVFLALSFSGVPRWLNTASNISNCIVFLIADGLLVRV
jgi:hypothetical protein